jgi:hypothetical protein
MSTNIILPKGTILHHYRNEDNKDRSYRWCYLATQKYIPQAGEPFEKHEYETLNDIVLKEYDLAKLSNKYTREVVTEPGIYTSDMYHFSRRPDINAKNNLDETSIITWEKTIDINEPFDSLRGIVLEKVGEELEGYEESKYEVVEYEIILDEKLIKLNSVKPLKIISEKVRKRQLHKLFKKFQQK